MIQSNWHRDRYQNIYYLARKFGDSTGHSLENRTFSLKEVNLFLIGATWLKLKVVWSYIFKDIISYSRPSLKTFKEQTLSFVDYIGRIILMGSQKIISSLETRIYIPDFTVIASFRT